METASSDLDKKAEGMFARFAFWAAKRLPGVKDSFLRRMAQERMRDLKAINHTFLNQLQKFSVTLGKRHYDADQIVAATVDLCTEMRTAMCGFLSLNDHQLHCCLKMVKPPTEGNDDLRLATLGTSRPFDEDRPRMSPGTISCRASTVYSALNGGNDGEINWRRMPCFCCNDLSKHYKIFKSPRPDWSKYYQSALIYPVRYVRNPDTDSREYDEIGFLAFDSPAAGVFAGMPNSYEFAQKPSEFKDKLAECPVFHFGSIFASCLSNALFGVYNPGLEQEESHGSQTTNISRVQLSPEGKDHRAIAKRGPDTDRLPLPNAGESK